MIRFVLVTGIVAGCAGTAAQTDRPITGDRLTPRSPGHQESTRVAGFDFREIVTGGAHPDDTLPMIVGLHYMSGSPATAAEDYALDRPTRLILPAGEYTFRNGYSWFPVADTARSEAVQAARGLSTAERLAAFVTAVTATRPTRGKPIVTGFSHGGDLSYLLAVRYPHLVAAALPMGARLLPPWRTRPPGAADFPVIAVFHGRDDPIVPVEHAREAVNALRIAGYPVEFYEYADTGHAYPAQMRRDYRRVMEALLLRRPPD